jgi:D-xylose 1-dehydrogenase (NADP+, D-xylono-1,5-lactone-forming)
MRPGPSPLRLRAQRPHIAADDPVRWGVLGAGCRTTAALAPAVHAAPGARLFAAAARDPGRAAALGPAVVHPDYAAVVADPDVEAVYLCLPNDAHRPWVIAALEAGKHVLCEPPLGRTDAEVADLVAAADWADRLLVEASWYRWHPRTVRAQEIVAVGRLGRVTAASAGFLAAPPAAGTYRLDPAHGGGALLDVGCYAASALLWALGWPGHVTVTATQQLGPTGVDLRTDAQLRLPGTTAELTAWMGERTRQWLAVTGTDGSLKLGGNAFTAGPGEATTLRVTDASGTTVESFDPADAYALAVSEVSSVLRGGPGRVVTPAESVATAALLDAVRAAATSGGSVAAGLR